MPPPRARVGGAWWQPQGRQQHARALALACAALVTYACAWHRGSWPLATSVAPRRAAYAGPCARELQLLGPDEGLATDARAPQVRMRVARPAVGASYRTDQLDDSGLPPSIVRSQSVLAVGYLGADPLLCLRCSLGDARAT